MGAMIALDLAARYPHLCLGVVALNAIFRRSAPAAAAVRARAAALTGDAPADPGPALRRWFGNDVSSAEAVACRRWLRDVDPAAYRAAYTVFAREDGPSSDALRALRCPARFVTGSEEPNSTPEMSRRMAALSPGGDALIVDGAAHMMPMTHADAVNRALIDFLGRRPGGNR
jgi:pimeloyl-ACP methyl ester carboxylesterase